MDWIKLYSRKWLFGSGRAMTPEKRGVWVDLLALAAEAKLRDGTLRLDVGQPMGRDYIASVLMIDRQTLDACLAAYQADKNTDDGRGRIEIWEDGTIEITNWDKYQGMPEKVQAKKEAIEKSKEGRRRQEVATDALVRAVNRLNTQLQHQRYEATTDGKVLDKQTGEIKELVEITN